MLEQKKNATRKSIEDLRMVLAEFIKFQKVLFSTGDKDISYSELISCCQAPNSPLSEKQARQMFTLLDKKFLGVVSARRVIEFAVSGIISDDDLRPHGRLLALPLPQTRPPSEKIMPYQSSGETGRDRMMNIEFKTLHIGDKGGSRLKWKGMCFNF